MSVAALAAAAVVFGPPGLEDPRLDLTLNAHDRWLRGALIQYCLSGDEGSGCRDPYPDAADLRRRIRIAPGERVHVRPRVAASRVSVRWGRRWPLAYHRPGPEIEARRTADGRWRFRMPRRARTARFLAVHVEYGGSGSDFADFYAGVRVRR